MSEEIQSKELCNAWYKSQDVRDRITASVCCSDSVKEIFVSGKGDNIVRSHGLFVTPETAGSMDDAFWSRAGSASVYSSMVNFRHDMAGHVQAVIKSMHMSIIVQTMVRNYLFRTLKHDASLFHSMSFALDIDAHGKPVSSCSPTVLAIDRLFWDYGVDSHAILCSGRGFHVRIPDQVMQKLIDFDMLRDTMTGKPFIGHRQTGMNKLTGMYTDLTGQLVSRLKTNEPKLDHGCIDTGLHTDSSRVLRIPYSIHPSNDNIVVPLQKSCLETTLGTLADDPGMFRLDRVTDLKNLIANRYADSRYPAELSGPALDRNVRGLREMFEGAW